jgi:hypothetical protein
MLSIDWQSALVLFMANAHREVLTNRIASAISNPAPEADTPTPDTKRIVLTTPLPAKGTTSISRFIFISKI